MKRPLPLLLTALAASLCAACASAPQSDTQRLTSEIVSGSSLNRTCSTDEIPSCITTGTRIHNANAQKICGCLVRELLIQAPAFR
jgi:type IV pilus biogenesis protein CpaD/CtpE